MPRSSQRDDWRGKWGQTQQGFECQPKRYRIRRGGHGKVLGRGRMESGFTSLLNLSRSEARTQ